MLKVIALLVISFIAGCNIPHDSTKLDKKAAGSRVIIGEATEEQYDESNARYNNRKNKAIEKEMKSEYDPGTTGNPGPLKDE